jgi:hypothetical protein
MSTNKDQIGKLELAFQKLAEETKKQFDDLEKSLENIASYLKKGFSRSLQQSIKEIVDKKSSTEESSLQNTVQISSPKSTPLIQPVTQSTDNPQPVQPSKTHNQATINTLTHACNIDAETTPKNPYKIVLLRTKHIPIRVFSFKKLEMDGKPSSERPPRKRMRSLQIQPAAQPPNSQTPLMKSTWKKSKAEIFCSFSSTSSLDVSKKKKGETKKEKKKGVDVLVEDGGILIDV